jgi:hypothetical protein
MKQTIYKVMRKCEGTNWRTCSLRDYNGKLLKRAETTSVELANYNKNMLKSEFPDDTYAILGY